MSATVWTDRWLLGGRSGLCVAEFTWTNAVQEKGKNPRSRYALMRHHGGRKCQCGYDRVGKIDVDLQAHEQYAQGYHQNVVQKVNAVCRGGNKSQGVVFIVEQPLEEKEAH